MSLLRTFPRQIRETQIQGKFGALSSDRATEMSRVPGKTSKVSNIKSVLKPTQVDWASSLR